MRVDNFRGLLHESSAALEDLQEAIQIVRLGERVARRTLVRGPAAPIKSDLKEISDLRLSIGRGRHTKKPLFSKPFS